MQIGDLIQVRYGAMTLQCHVAEIYPNGRLKVYSDRVLDGTGKPINVFLVQPYTAYEVIERMFA